MGNIYEKLEIKDYSLFQDFIEEVQDRFTLCDQYDAIVIYGDKEFIHKCMIQFAERYGFKIAYAELYNIDNSYYRGEFMLEAEYSQYQEDIVMWVQPARYSDCSSDGEEHFVNVNLGLEYTRVFINQDGVKQDLVDKCLRDDDEVMLFGIEEKLSECFEDENNDQRDDGVTFCDEHCPWWEECETDNK